MGERIQHLDWSETSLGPPEAWPRSLKTAMDIAISSRQPMFIAWGLELTFVYNDAYADILADKHPDALGKPFRRVWWDIWDDIEPLVDRALAGQATWSENLPLNMERKGFREDTWWTFSYSPVRDDEGRVAGMFCSCVETTAQVLAERQSMAERQRLFEMSRDLIGVATFGGYLKSINPAWSRTLQRSDEELLAKPFSAIIHPDDLATTADVVAALMRGEPVHQFQVRLLRSNGEPVSFAWSAVPEGTRESEIFYTVGRDITEELRREEMLRQAQKMEAVGQLTGGLAHDFNNLLTGITGSLELLTNRIAQGRVHDVERYVAAAQGAAKRAAALTHRLLAFSRRQTLDPKPTDVNRVVAGMQELIQRTVGPAIPVEVVGASGLWPAVVDASQLENALLNLCLNARDAMPEGGRITIETGNKWLDERAAFQQGMAEGQYLSVCVTDTGTGMAADVIAKAFDPFFTTKPIGEGTGLGLSMIYGFAKQSGGAVRIYSEVGKGTTVCVYLPRSHGAVAHEERDDKLRELPQPDQGATVLVVDDEPTVRMLIADILEDLGHTAIEAGDSAAGLKILHSDARIDLLVTDVGLPGGMNGRQMADAGRVSRPDLRVLFITGYAENAVVGNGHLAPGMAVLTKPFTIGATAARIRSLIEAGREAERHRQSSG